jgi:hypothetical protein
LHRVAIEKLSAFVYDAQLDETRPLTSTSEVCGAQEIGCPKVNYRNSSATKVDAERECLADESSVQQEAVTHTGGLTDTRKLAFNAIQQAGLWYERQHRKQTKSCHAADSEQTPPKFALHANSAGSPASYAKEAESTHAHGPAVIQ